MTFVTQLCVMMTLFITGVMTIKHSCTVDDDLCSRDDLLKVTYGTRAAIACNETVPKQQTETKPLIEYSGGDEGAKYLLVMVDPDAPTGCFMHDIETVTIEKDELKSGEIIVGYRPPTPPWGVHRYQFFLYKWSKTGADVIYKKYEDFQLSKFEKDNGLVKPEAVFQILVGHKDE